MWRDRDVNAMIIRNGRIIDPANRRDKIGDLFIRDGRVAKEGEIENLKSEIGMHATVVNPPAAAARAPLAIVSFQENPGSRRCT